MSHAELTFLLRRHAADGSIPLPRQGDAVPIGPQHPSYDESRITRLLVEGAKEVTGRLDVDAVLEHAFLALAKAVSLHRRVDPARRGRPGAHRRGLPDSDRGRAGRPDPAGQGVSGAIAATGEPRYLPDITIASTVTARRRSKSASPGCAPGTASR